MNYRTLLISTLSVLLAGLWIAGCGDSGNKTIATVNDYEITQSELEQSLNKMPDQFATAQDEFDALRGQLDSVIITRMLIQAAYEHNIDQLEEVARVVLANKDKFLIDVLYSRHIADKADVSDAEIREYYDNLANKLRAYQIVVKNADTAQMLFERLKEGADIEQLAYQYSIDPGARRNRGDMGYFVWGAMPDEFQEVAFAMEPGEIAPPVKTQVGWHIIKLVDKTHNDLRGTFDQEKESIKEQILRRKHAKLIDQYYDVIKQKYPITVHQDVCDYLLHKREELYPPQLLASLPRSDFDIEQLDRNERELVLASWEGGEVSVLDYLVQARNIPNQVKPDLDNYDSLKTIIFLLKNMDILAYEATLEGLENDQEFKDKMHRFKELAMAEIMRNDSIPKPEPVTEQLARKYYDEHPAEYSNPAKIHLYEILVSDELQARKLAQEIKSLADFKERAMDLTERPGKRAASGDLGYIEREWFPQIFDRAWKAPLNRVGGPVFVNGKYSIFWVVDRLQAELKDFLAVKREIMMKLDRDRHNETFQKWVDEQKEKTDIEVNEDALWSMVDTEAYAATEAPDEQVTN
jgi:peptidyl-prolyl cis-trans isomerase C